jgi:cell division septal protein FtsQ
MILDRLFARNTRRKKDAVRGNYAFRSRRRRVRLEVHRLDMNPETPASIREKRRKVMRWGFKLAVASLVLTGIVSAGKIVVREAFMDSPRFKLQHLSVITDGSLQPSAIIAAAGLREGANMLGISLVQVRERLEQLPEVRHAKVSRGYPGVIFLEVEQRQPTAWLECPRLRLAAGDRQSGCLLDADGFVLPSGQSAVGLKNLPVIHVEQLSRLAPGQCLESPEVHAALKLLQSHAASELAHSAAIRRIDASRGYALTVTFDSQLTAILPADDVARQLQRLARVIHEAEDQQWQIATVDLLVEKNVPVTLRGSNPAPTVPTGTSAPAQRRPGRTLARVN